MTGPHWDGDESEIVEVRLRLGGRVPKPDSSDHPLEETSMTEHVDDGPELPEGFEKVEATVCRRGEELIVFGALEEGPFVFHLRLARKEEADFGPPPPGFGWTGEERPPKKGEWFWSELRGRAIQAVKDETGVNQFGEPTGGRRILKPLGTSGRAVPPPRTGLRLVKSEDPAD